MKEYNYTMLASIFNVSYEIVKQHLYDMRRKHRFQKDWLKDKINEDGRIEKIVNEECFEWLKEVSFNYNQIKIDAEINFFKKKIEIYERKLGISHKELDYSNMTKKELEEFYSKSQTTIKNVINKMCSEFLKDYKIYDEKGRVVILSDGVKWIEENCFKREHLLRLEQYHIELKKQLKGELQNAK